MNIVLNMIRGGLIGMAELVPGISGGTIALVTGVYERTLHDANRFLDAVKRFPNDRPESTRLFKSVDWALLIPMAIGMALVVTTLAGPMEAFVSDQPIQSRALFMGMVIASLIVPWQMIDKIDLHKKRPVAIPAFLLSTAATFFLTSLTSTPQENPNLFWVFVAAAIAVCALVLPGVSGSFFLLAVGLYNATMGAIHDRDLLYIAVFALGALTGLVLFVRTLEKLLTTARTMTLVVMLGLLLGSLRALWPWQGDNAELLAPGDHLGLGLGLIALGFCIVLGMIFAERRLQD